MNFLPPFLLLFVLLRVMTWRRAVRSTSAASAANWAIAAVTALFVCSLLLAMNSISVRMMSGLQYAAAVLMLTPFVDILGARRPAHNAWPWFVVIPMIVVLQWPVASQLASGNANIAVELPTPTFCGFVLVVVMGCGNYFGTQYTTASLLTAISCILVALPVTELLEFGHPWYFRAACGTLALAAWSVPRKISHPPVHGPKERLHFELWANFRDIYGMVWAKRVMDRVNQFGAREKWNVHLTLDGFQPVNPIDNDATAPTQIEPVQAVVPVPAVVNVEDRPLVILCWVLRRFADHEYLQTYLPKSIVEAKPNNAAEV